MSHNQDIKHIMVIDIPQGKYTINLKSATCSIGRDRTNTIVLKYPQISRYHATLLRITIPDTSNYRFRLIDGNLQGKRSTNGITVNDCRCLSHDLQDGDKIVFGGNIEATYHVICNPEKSHYLKDRKTINQSDSFSKSSNRYETLAIVKPDYKESTERAIERLASFPELISNPIIEVNMAGKITYLNPAAICQFPTIQTEPEHPILAGIINLVKENKKSHLVREIEINEQIYEQTLNYIMASDVVRCQVADITQRKQAEKALHDHRLLQRAILNSANYIIIATDLNGKILTFNAAAENFLQYTAAEVINKQSPTFFIDQNQLKQGANSLSNQGIAVKAGFETLVAQARKGQLEEREWTLIRKDGTRFPVMLSVNALEDEHNTVEGFLVTGIDITERKQAEILLQKAHDDLEIKVLERTKELAKINESLKAEIEERKQAEKELRLLQTISQAITEAPNFESAIAITIANICKTISWNYAEAWTFDSVDQFLKLNSTWCQPQEQNSIQESNKQLLEFGKASRKYTFASNIGIPGRIWATKNLEWYCDISTQSEKIFKRIKLAQKYGLKAVLGVPLIANHKIIAVLVFFAVSSVKNNQRIVKLVNSVVNQLSLIIEHKRAEDALKSSMDTNRALLNAIPDSILRISREGTFVNYKASKNNKLPIISNDESLGKHLYEIFPKDVANLMLNCVTQALSTGQVQILECQLPVDNEILNFELRITTSAENEVMAIVRDITERKQAEENMRNALEKEKQLNELKSRFISMTSHEFRTPMATILSSSELLEHYSHKWNEEKKLRHLQRIQTSVKHMTGLLNDVLLIGKAEAGKLEFKPILLDLKYFCEELVEEIQLSTNNHQILLEVPDSDCQYNMDDKLLRHILTNLLSNAIKYSPESDKIRFELLDNQKQVIFIVQDYGIGIPEEDQTELFSTFHRASNVGSIAGTGLGLSVVKKSVETHGGTIEVNSKLGIGSTFTVILPKTI